MTAAATVGAAEPRRDQTVPAVVATAAVVAAVIDLLQVLRPGYLFGLTPDISVWFGASVRLVHGAIPYRDFVFDQPPGIVLLLSPFALLSKALGTRDALAAVRLCTPLLAAANVVLAGRLVRHRGPRATLATCFCMALYPAAVYAMNGGLLEPVEDLLCLGALVLIFDGDRLAGSRGFLAGGVLLGLAGAVKASALAPVVVLVVLCAVLARRRLAPLVGGAAAGFAVPSLPFFVVAPAGFIQGVVLTQVTRFPGTARASIIDRLARMTFGGRPVGVLAVVAVVIVLLYALCVVAWLRWRRGRLTPLDWFALSGFGAVFAVQFVTSQYFLQYAAFLAPFAALLLGLSLGRLGPRRVTRRAAALCAAALLAVVASEVIVVELSSTPDVAAAVTAVVPAGACALSDNPSILVSAGRFVSTVPGCTEMTDPFGTELRFAGDPRGGVDAYRAALTHADYLVLGVSLAQWLDGPYTPLRAYVADDFHLRRSGTLNVYVRDGFPLAGNQ